MEDEFESFENETFKKIKENDQVFGFIHNGFWKWLDTQRELKLLNDLWDKGIAPWKRW